MPTPPRAMLLYTLCQELRGVIGEGPRNDARSLQHALTLLTQLRQDPYASQHSYERIAKLWRALEQWLTAAGGMDASRSAEMRESMVLELAQLETEQRLRSWLMEIVK